MVVIDVGSLITEIEVLMIAGINLLDTWQFAVYGVTLTVLDIALMFIAVRFTIQFIYGILED